jgi:hypothetical protein
MMMTSGSGVNYKSMFDAGSQIIAKEGTKSLFKGAGANILRGVAGAGVLSLYDKLQEVMFGKVYSGGMCLASKESAANLTINPCSRIRLNGVRLSSRCYFIILHSTWYRSLDVLVFILSSSRWVSLIPQKAFPTIIAGKCEFTLSRCDVAVTDCLTYPPPVKLKVLNAMAFATPAFDSTQELARSKCTS